LQHDKVALALLRYFDEGITCHVLNSIMCLYTTTIL
jgi:hypothetical protein